MRIIFVFLTLLICSGLNAQESPLDPQPEGVPIVRAGLFFQGGHPSILANFSDHPGVQGGGFNGGVFIRKEIGKDFFLRPELNLRVAGVRGEYVHRLNGSDSIPYVERETDTRLNEFVLEIPVIIEYQVEPKIMGYGGLHLAYMLNQQITILDEARLFEGLSGFELAKRNTSFVERMEIGFTMGVTAQLKYNTWLDVRLTRFAAEAGRMFDRYDYSRGGLTFGASLCFAFQ